MRTLVFPSSVPAGLEYARAARERQEPLIGASSLAYDDTAAKYPEWERLPSIHDGAFLDAFRSLVTRKDVTRVFCAVPSVHVFLVDLIERHRLPLRVINRLQMEVQTDAYRGLMEEAGRVIEFARDVHATRQPPLTVARVSAALRLAATTYGESSDNKIAALIAAIADAPRGDVVEVGNLVGKSASVLVFLARVLKVGPALTVDPWRPEHWAQHDAPASTRKLETAWEGDLLAAAFAINLLPLSEHHAHLRLPSVEGYKQYAEKLSAPNDEGTVQYSGRIALMHIDGNHDLTAVQEDCRLWSRHVVPGGWLVLDDYTWAHGDGPKRVGDAFVETRWRDIDRAFVCGGALFLKLKP